MDISCDKSKDISCDKSMILAVIKAWILAVIKAVIISVVKAWISCKSMVKATHRLAVIWGNIRSVNGGLYCLLQTQSHHEWSWIQFYRCHSRDQRAHWLPESAEHPRSHLRILHFSASAVAVCLWKRTPPFGGLYEAVVCSMKIHLCHILWPVKLNFEQLSTVLSQVEACMNSRPLVALMMEWKP